MHATDVLDTCLPAVCQTMHAARLTVLKVAVDSALTQRCVTVTSLGRGIVGDIDERYCIKRMDRLIGNVHLLRESALVYEGIAGWLLGGFNRPLIVVDWSPLSPDERFHLLRASVPVSGRALAIYEEVHEREYLGSREVQNRFLAEIAARIPSQCRPVIVADAGFKNPWFRAVGKLGWDWIGRIRGTVQVTRPEEDVWMRCRFLQVPTGTVYLLDALALPSGEMSKLSPELSARACSARLGRAGAGFGSSMTHWPAERWPPMGGNAVQPFRSSTMAVVTALTRTVPSFPEAQAGILR